MLILFILSIISLVVGFGGAWANANTPLQTPLWMGIPVGVVLIAICFGGVIF